MNKLTHRLYTFTNCYLSSIQHGIQSAHVVSELFSKYHRNNDMLNNWADFGKTIIVCNGGNNEMLVNLWGDIEKFGNELELPFVKFYEDEESLSGMLTCIGIIVPINMYNAWTRDGVWYYDGGGVGNQAPFISLLKSYKLAS